MGETLSSWSELRQHLATRFPRHHDTMGDDAIRFGFPFRDEDLGVFFSHSLRGASTSWVFIGVRLVPATGVNLKALLLAGTSGPVGALSLARDYLCTSCNLPVVGLSANHLDWTLQALAGSALRHRSLLASTQPDSAMFSYLTDT